MIARLFVELPFSFIIPNKEKFQIWEYTFDEYQIRVFPPKCKDAKTQSKDCGININGVEAFEANILWIDFLKDSFDRKIQRESDPPSAVISSAVNEFLERLRYVLNAPQIKPINFEEYPWRLTYLYDDGNIVEKKEGYVRARGAMAVSFEWTALNTDIWNDIHELKPGWTPPVWKSLLLDARSLLPEVGPSIVLTATALEVFISQALNIFAEKHQTPNEIWEWLNNRNWLKKPSVEEQYDFLLEFFIGKSLKSDSKLWEDFKNLKNSRNSFVHDGVPTIGNNIVGVEKAKMFICVAEDIIDFVMENIPDEHKLPKYENKVNANMTKTVGDSGIWNFGSK